MQYPLELSFKILAFAPQISVMDASGSLLLYVRQKALKLREEVTVFADAEQTRPLYQIRADRVIDFSARYQFTDINGMDLGAVKRQGMRSLWKSHYDILDGDTVALTVQEENAWVKVLDGLFTGIPVVGLFSGYVFNPVFLVLRPDGTVVMRLEKQPSFLQSRFTIRKLVDMDEQDERRILLSLLMMILLERTRG